MARREFDPVLRMIRKACPVSVPVRVVSRELGSERLCGSCTTYVFPDNTIERFLIEIDNTLSRISAVDTLLHEWAHAMDQDRNGVTTDSHRDSWGLCYAETWRAYTTKMPE
jgi:hypothetical protein